MRRVFVLLLAMGSFSIFGMQGIASATSPSTGLQALDACSGEKSITCFSSLDMHLTTLFTKENREDAVRSANRLKGKFQIAASKRKGGSTSPKIKFGRGKSKKSKKSIGSRFFKSGRSKTKKRSRLSPAARKAQKSRIIKVAKKAAAKLARAYNVSKGNAESASKKCIRATGTIDHKCINKKVRELRWANIKKRGGNKSCMDMPRGTRQSLAVWTKNCIDRTPRKSGYYKAYADETFKKFLWSYGLRKDRKLKDWAKKRYYRCSNYGVKAGVWNCVYKLASEIRKEEVKKESRKGKKVRDALAKKMNVSVGAIKDVWKVCLAKRLPREMGYAIRSGQKGDPPFANNFEKTRRCTQKPWAAKAKAAKAKAYKAKAAKAKAARDKARKAKRPALKAKWAARKAKRAALKAKRDERDQKRDERDQKRAERDQKRAERKCKRKFKKDKRNQRDCLRKARRAASVRKRAERECKRKFRSKYSAVRGDRRKQRDCLRKARKSKKRVSRKSLRAKKRVSRKSRRSRKQEARDRKRAERECKRKFRSKRDRRKQRDCLRKARKSKKRVSRKSLRAKKRVSRKSRRSNRQQEALDRKHAERVCRKFKKDKRKQRDCVDHTIAKSVCRRSTKDKRKQRGCIDRTIAKSECSREFRKDRKKRIACLRRALRAKKSKSRRSRRGAPAN